jgi:hypothetical protein
MFGMLGDWDENIYEQMVEDRGQIDEADMPMPIFINNFI